MKNKLEINKPIHFIDCGANVGQSCAWALEYYGDKLFRVDSFEPQHENIVCFHKRFDNNSLVRLHEKAVWLANEEKKFYVQQFGCRTGSSLISGKTSTKENEYVTVNCIDISEWLIDNTNRQANYVIFKCDIEGAEFNVMPHMIMNNSNELIDELFLEFHAIGKVPNYDSSVIQMVENNFRCITNWGKMVADVELYRDGY